MRRFEPGDRVGPSDLLLANFPEIGEEEIRGTIIEFSPSSQTAIVRWDWDDECLSIPIDSIKIIYELSNKQTFTPK